MQQYQTTRADLAPWRTAGGAALQRLSDLYGLGDVGAGAKSLGQTGAMDAFKTSPDYQFRLDEGLRALQTTAAARGNLNSGDQLRAITDYGQGLASTEYGNYVNRLSGITGTGQTATTQTGQFGALAATNAGDAIQNAGAARASGYAGAANAWNQGLQSASGSVGFGLGAAQKWWQPSNTDAGMSFYAGTR